MPYNFRINDDEDCETSCPNCGDNPCGGMVAVVPIGREYRVGICQPVCLDCAVEKLERFGVDVGTVNEIIGLAVDRNRSLQDEGYVILIRPTSPTQARVGVVSIEVALRICNTTIDGLDSIGTMMYTVTCGSAELSCQVCGSADRVEVYPDSNGQRLCHAHFTERTSRSIQNYTFKPAPIFHGDESSPMMGVELEVTSHLMDHNAAAKKILAEANKFLKAYCKSDSSVENGFEVVTHPFTFDFMRKHEKKIREVFAVMGECGIFSGKEHDISANGMHIHISRTALNNEQWARFVSIFYSNPGFTWALSNRTDVDKFKHYASLYCDVSPEVAVDRWYMIPGERHSAISFTDNTVELRFFNATVDPFIFMSNVEIANAAVKAVRDTSGLRTPEEMFRCAHMGNHAKGLFMRAIQREVPYSTVNQITQRWRGR